MQKTVSIIVFKFLEQNYFEMGNVKHPLMKPKTFISQEKTGGSCNSGTRPLRSNSERKIGFFSGHSCLWKVRLIPNNS